MDSLIVGRKKWRVKYAEKEVKCTFVRAALGASIWLPGQVSAEVRTVEADGFYQMGNGMAENQAIAKERGRFLQSNYF